MNVQPPASYSLRAAERLRRAIFALAAGAAATATGQSTEGSAEADATTTNRLAIVPRAVDLDARSLPMTPMLTTPRLTTAELQALQNMTPRPISTFSPEELEQFREEFLTPRTIDIEPLDPAALDAILTAVTNAVPTATNAVPAATNAVPAATEAAASQAAGEARSEP